MILRRVLKIFQIVFIVFMSGILAVNIYLLASRIILKSELPKFFGFAQIIVVSGSMQPAFDTGDMLIIREQSDYYVNDIITYNTGRSFITHRAIEVGDTHIVARGDANNVDDDAIPISSVEGKVVYIIPGAGNIILFLKSPLGILTMLVVLFLLIEIPYIVERLKQKQK